MLGKNQANALSKPPGHGLGHLGKDSQNNVEKVLLAAGADCNLHGLLQRGQAEVEER